MKVYGLTTCKRTRQALAWLKAQNVDFEFQNFKTEGISPGKLKGWDATSGYATFLNKKSLTWKRLPAEVRESIKNSENALALLVEEPAIIKRPVIEDENFLLFGFDEKVYREHFLHHQ
ncbi:transcriptional regulator, Spx/MgsR family [Mucilaginibacter gossypiicola]|uniref:Transcriptional regulator, Spx/MgsR family n=1 Tax=Mucilaginibacter gossypiicola TaxID=551995 RepID=A0A1H8BCL3_9SPHI|nr:Spx/MgsR family RNA polymerase-binding regulatory protein [Mucilaginibacter gossypiicola]SEM80701.1 transcriptional regulator, Spx/MgsR family [Mucilaginibacter gossypiicola]